MLHSNNSCINFGSGVSFISGEIKMLLALYNDNGQLLFQEIRFRSSATNLDRSSLEVSCFGLNRFKIMRVKKILFAYTWEIKLVSPQAGK